MPRTGIFFLPALPSASSTDSLPPSQLIFTNLAAEHHLVPLPAWTLEHRLFRETSVASSAMGDNSNGNNNSNATSPSTGYLQVLTLSFHTGTCYAGITKPKRSTSLAAAKAAGAGVTAAAGDSSSSSSSSLAPATIISIPSGVVGEEFAQLLVSRFGPMWMQRQVLQVGNGQGYEVEDFMIRFGEVREARQGQGSAAGHVRGTVAQITRVGNVGESEASAEDSIRHFWRELQLPGAKEFMTVSGAELGSGDVRQWLEAMRLRA